MERAYVANFLWFILVFFPMLVSVEAYIDVYLKNEFSSGSN